LSAEHNKRRANEMTAAAAAAAAEYRSNVGPDFTLADTYDADYLDDELAEDEAVERQALNARMAEWYGIG
jgi:hypothetical protein